MPETPSSYERVTNGNSLPGRLPWLIALPAAVSAALSATTAGYLSAEGDHTVLIAICVVAVTVVLIACVYAIRLARASGAPTAGPDRVRAELAAARSTLAEKGSELAAARADLGEARTDLAAARSEVARLTEHVRLAESRAVAVPSATQTAGRQVEVFVNLSRRLQSLVHREIKLLDALENEVEDPDLLKGLFQVDHLATRIRRHAENLAVLGGSVSRRQWSRPVALTEVLRSAIAEVEHYSRVKLVPPIEGTVPGHAVASIIHLVAELIENATMFAPPQTQVLLRSQQVTSGVAIEVEDRGLGMQRIDQERVNQLLANPEDINLDDLLRDGRIGLFVVSMIARQHGIVVRLQTNIYGGTQAVVILPRLLLGAETGETGERPQTLAEATVGHHTSAQPIVSPDAQPALTQHAQSPHTQTSHTQTQLTQTQLTQTQPGEHTQVQPALTQHALAQQNLTQQTVTQPALTPQVLAQHDRHHQALTQQGGTPQAGAPLAGTPQAGTPQAGTPQTGLQHVVSQHTVEIAQQDRWSAFTPASGGSRSASAGADHPYRPANSAAAPESAAGPSQRSATQETGQQPFSSLAGSALSGSSATDSQQPTAARPPLPRRRSQTHLAPQLKLGPPRVSEEPAGEHNPRLMASFMNGVSQGEADQPHPDRHG